MRTYHSLSLLSLRCYLRSSLRREPSCRRPMRSKLRPIAAYRHHRRSKSGRASVEGGPISVSATPAPASISISAVTAAPSSLAIA